MPSVNLPPAARDVLGGVRRRVSRPQSVVISFLAADSSTTAYVLGSHRLATGNNDAARTYRTGLARGFQAIGVSVYVIEQTSLTQLLEHTANARQRRAAEKVH